jgi:hypothetical protein
MIVELDKQPGAPKAQAFGQSSGGDLVAQPSFRPGHSPQRDAAQDRRCLPVPKRRISH